MSTAIERRKTELLTGRVPFVHVTVVRAEKPTSVRAGDNAIVLADGSIEGFVGGICAEGSVRSAALASLADGETMLLRVLPDSDEAFPVSPGAQVVTNPCLSGGAMEMFLEPLLPPPVIGVLGDTPIANALRVMAGSLGFEVGLLEDVGHAVAVIVSSHGRDEQAPIRAALDAGVGFVGLVASRRRGQAVLSELRLSDDERARVHTPVGLWIGAKTADEIALSIMAELVKAIRLDGLTAPDSAPAVTRAESATARQPDPEAAVTAVDPICGMTVTVGPDTPHLHLDGTDHWFCCAGCRDRFAASAGAA